MVASRASAAEIDERFGVGAAADARLRAVAEEGGRQHRRRRPRARPCARPPPGGNSRQRTQRCRARRGAPAQPTQSTRDGRRVGVGGERALERCRRLVGAASRAQPRVGDGEIGVGTKAHAHLLGLCQRLPRAPPPRARRRRGAARRRCVQPRAPAMPDERLVGSAGARQRRRSLAVGSQLARRRAALGRRRRDARRQRAPPPAPSAAAPTAARSSAGGAALALQRDGVVLVRSSSAPSITQHRPARSRAFAWVASARSAACSRVSASAGRGGSAASRHAARLLSSTALSGRSTSARSYQPRAAGISPRPYAALPRCR